MVQIIKLLEVLTQAKVDFVLVGGAAAAAYGSTMVTQDLDVCGEMSSKNLCRLATAMAPFNPCHRMDPRSLRGKPTITFGRFLDQYFITFDPHFSKGSHGPTPRPRKRIHPPKNRQ